MAHYRAGDSRREQFRRYLEKGGVLDMLTKVLVALYEEPEKPNNAMDFLKQHLGTAGPETADVETLRLEVIELRQKYELLLEENKDLKAKGIQKVQRTEKEKTRDIRRFNMYPDNTQVNFTSTISSLSFQTLSPG
ncbi:C-Myc-binding protein isoform X1 [Scyliorhinus torazame]|uniref:C-Myc-binding protein isoform X1 n=1 Tax=Scyliorhinus torazame TaxID=75743 RepID=UPI003B59028B